MQDNMKEESNSKEIPVDMPYRYGNSIIRPIDSWDIASKLIYLSNEDREKRINKLSLDETRRVVRNILNGYDKDELDHRTFLEKLYKKNINKYNG